MPFHPSEDFCFGLPRRRCSDSEPVMSSRGESPHVEGTVWKMKQGSSSAFRFKLSAWNTKFAILHDQSLHLYQSFPAFMAGEGPKEIPLGGAIVAQHGFVDGPSGCCVFSVTQCSDARQHFFCVSSAPSCAKWVMCLTEVASAVPRDLRSYPTKEPCDWEGARDDVSREEARRLRIRTVVQGLQEDKEHWDKVRGAAEQEPRPHHHYATHEPCVPRSPLGGDSPGTASSKRRGKGVMFREQNDFDLGCRGDDSEDRRRDEIKTELEYLLGVSHTKCVDETGQGSEFGRRLSSLGFSGV